VDNLTVLVVLDNKIYGVGSSSSFGYEIYSYDGISVKRITDVTAGKGNGFGAMGAGGPLAFYKGSIYFAGAADGNNYQLYAFEPQSGSTRLVYTVNPAGNGRVGSLYVYKSKLYFKGWTPTLGHELYVYDGASTRLVADIWPGPGNGTPISGSYFSELKGYLYFTANDSTHGEELWRLHDATGIQAANWSGSASVHPNPAIDATTLSIDLQSPQLLRISISDISGKEVYNHGIKPFPSGRNEIILPLQGFASGQYVYRITEAAGAQLAAGAIVKQ
jgi:ELWxxDGT repeat protein